MLRYEYHENSFNIYENNNLKVVVPQLIYYNVNRFNFTDSRPYKGGNDFFYINFGNRVSIFNEDEFKLNIFNIIKLCKCVPINNDFINNIQTDIVSGDLLREVKRNSINGFISDCLFFNINYNNSRPFSTESNFLIYNSRNSVEIINPASSFCALYSGYSEGEPTIQLIENKYKNFSLPWEFLTRRSSEVDFQTAKNILTDLYNVSNGERLEYTNFILDYIFAMLFKYNGYQKQLDWNLFPILLLTGTKSSGKSTLVKTLCNFFWEKEDDFFYTSSKLEGANLLTRFHNIHALTVLPIVLDDLQELSDYTRLINPTLTQGFISEEIGSSGGKNITRKMFNTIIITANNINIMQGGGSDAAVDRFIELNILEQPLNNIEAKKKFNKLMGHSGNFNVIGKVILNILKNKQENILKPIDLPDFIWKLDNRKIDYVKMLLFGDRIRKIVMTEIMGVDGFFTEDLCLEKYFCENSRKTNITKNSDIIHDALLSLVNENIYIGGKYFNLKQFVISNDYLIGAQSLVQESEIFNQLISNLGIYQATNSKTGFGESGQFVTTSLFIKRIRDNIYRNNHKQFTITTELLAKELPEYFEKLISVNYYVRKSEQALPDRKLASYTLRFNMMQFLFDNKLIDDETITIIKSFGKWGGDGDGN